MVRIVHEIGSESERLRAVALASSREDRYWNSSRYSKHFLPLLPLHIFPSSDLHSLPTVSDQSSSLQGFQSLFRVSSLMSSGPPDQSHRSRLTPHTLHSMVFGSRYNFTTVTANHQSIRIISKELRPASTDGFAGLWSVGPRSLTSGQGVQ